MLQKEFRILRANPKIEKKGLSIEIDNLVFLW